MYGGDVEESLSEIGDAKLHGGMCKILSLIVHKVLEIFPFIEASRPKSKSGIQALCLLHVALDRAKTLLKHCSECSKLYLAITGDSILMKFEKARCALQDSLRRVEDIVPQAIGCQIVEIVGELEGTVFELDQSEKEVGDDTISLLQKERQSNSSQNNMELEIFHHVALRLGITSSRAALSERRALKKLIERSRAKEDKCKESIVSYLLHLMRKYSKLFRSDVGDDTDSQGSTPCSPTILSSFEDVSVPGGHDKAFSRHFSKRKSFSFNQNGRIRPANVPIPPEELRCPISLQLMYDPVIISSGQTYDRACIEKWFNDGHNTCPKTQQTLEHLGLTPNYCIKGLIASWCEHNGLTVPISPPESLDVNYWRMACSDCEATDSRSLGSLDSCMLKGVKVIPLGETGDEVELMRNEIDTLNNNYCEYVEADDVGQYETLLAALHENSSRRQKKAVEQIRFLLKDDEEGRIYMGANGAVDALVQILRSAVDEGDVRSQDIGAMALFNLAVNNNRNKGLLISAGVIPLLEFMISNSETKESATALYLNLSCLDEAKPLIGLSPATTFLIQSLYYGDFETISSKHDALYTLYNLSTHPSNIPSLLNAGIVSGLHSLITSSSPGDEGLTWVEKALAVLLNLALDKPGRKEIMSTPGLIAELATVLDIGEPAEQEQVVSCLLILCNGDEKCSQIVLQEGVIPALVSVSVNGTAKGREKAQKLLKLFREQRQRESSPVKAAESSGVVVVVAEPKPLCKTRSRLGRTLSSLWKNKNFSVYQC